MKIHRRFHALSSTVEDPKVEWGEGQWDDWRTEYLFRYTAQDFIGVLRLSKRASHITHPLRVMLTKKDLIVY
jgi:hypothetical protein